MKLRITSRYRTLFLLGILFLLSGCFEVIEDITLHANGSGSFKLTVNLSQSKGKIASLMLLDSVNGVKIPKVEDVRLKLEEAKKIAEATSGISNVKIESDFKNFIFMYQCDFTNVQALNHLVDRLSKHHKVDKLIPAKHPHFHYDAVNMIFTRSADYFNSVDYSRLKESERNIVEKGIIISVCHFQNKIKHCTNKSTVLAPTGNASMVKTPVANCIKGESTFSNKILLIK